MGDTELQYVDEAAVSRPRRTGEGPEASEHLTTAIALYREMGMSFWPERALAEMADPAPSAA